MRIVAGCDGGGTKCVVRAALVDGSTIVREAEGISGPANVSNNAEEAIHNVVAAVSEAVRKLNQADDLASACSVDCLVAALAGSATHGNPAELETRIGSVLPSRRVVVIPDAAVLFAAANIDREPALATVVGTGSIAWARDAAGNLHRAGGLGPERGDEGSGYWIGRCGAKAGIIQLTPEQANGDFAACDVAAMAPDVFSAAPHDPRASEIISSAAQHIADIVVEATVAMPSTAANPLHWVCAGGIVVNQAAWRENHSTDVCVTRSVPVTTFVGAGTCHRRTPGRDGIEQVFSRGCPSLATIQTLGDDTHQTIPLPAA